MTEPAPERVFTCARTRVQSRQQASPLAGFSTNSQPVTAALRTQAKTQAQAVFPAPSPLATQQPIAAEELEEGLTSEPLPKESPPPFAHPTPEPISPSLPLVQLAFQTIMAVPLTPAPPLLQSQLLLTMMATTRASIAVSITPMVNPMQNIPAAGQINSHPYATSAGLESIRSAGCAFGTQDSSS
ncbi:hypothetical protein BGY98DRAFT_1104157 [Russula aff. rugulosa BPL654]|nr:hypothetical protein BGY98DRAFT_1104157 [Russula aff. rugulosa BPL654]